MNSGQFYRSRIVHVSSREIWYSHIPDHSREYTVSYPLWSALSWMRFLKFE